MKTYDMVKSILENNPETRNSDKRLIWTYWKMEGLTYDYVDTDQHYITLRDFLKATSPESIRRCRQKIQSLHPELGPTSQLVRKQRRIKEATKSTFMYREDSGQGVFI